MKAFIIFLFVVACNVSSAQSPRTISYQGILLDGSGAVVPDGNHTLKLTFYETATGGTPLYTETHTTIVVKGIFNVMIGTVSAIPTSLLFDKPYFLAVSVDASADLSPRTPFATVPYTFHSELSEHSRTSDHSDSADHSFTSVRSDTANIALSVSVNATGVVHSINNQSGNITLMGGGGTTVTNNGSTVTISSTGAGATGIQGVQSTDGSINISNPNGPVADLKVPTNSITSINIKDSSLTIIDLAPGTIPTSLPPNGPAGGDLSGSYPNPTVTKINGVSFGSTSAAAGNMLIGDGSVWVARGISGDATVNAAGDLTLSSNAITNAKISDTAITTSKIADRSVTYAKMQNMSANSKLLGSNATGAGLPPSELTLGTGLSMTGSTLNSTGGTVTSVSVTTANGVSGAVANPTSTPAITLTLGAITPTSVTATNTVNQLTLGTTLTTVINAPTPSGNRNYTISDMGASANFALTTSAADNTLPKWSGTNGKLSNTTITDNGTDVTTSSNIVLSGTGKRISFKGTSTGVTTFEAGAQGGTNINYVLPTALPGANGVLVSNNSGTLSFASHKRVSAVQGAVQIINDPAVTASSTILATTEGTPSFLTITARNPGVSFTVTASVALLATDFINYQILP